MDIDQIFWNLLIEVFLVIVFVKIEIELIKNLLPVSKTLFKGNQCWKYSHLLSLYCLGQKYRQISTPNIFLLSFYSMRPLLNFMPYLLHFTLHFYFISEIFYILS